MPGTINLSDGEWKLMNLLWSSQPRTIAQLVAAVADDTGWTKATVFMMLRRMEEKGAVRVEQGTRMKYFYPAIDKAPVAARETESFLKKVYDGSLQLMVASMAGQKSLSRDDISKLYDILRSAEEDAEND